LHPSCSRQCPTLFESNKQNDDAFDEEYHALDVDRMVDIEPYNISRGNDFGDNVGLRDTAFEEPEEMANGKCSGYHLI